MKPVSPFFRIENLWDTGLASCSQVPANSFECACSSWLISYRVPSVSIYRLCRWSITFEYKDIFGCGLSELVVDVGLPKLCQDNSRRRSYLVQSLGGTPQAILSVSKPPNPPNFFFNVEPFRALFANEVTFAGAFAFDEKVGVLWDFSLKHGTFWGADSGQVDSPVVGTRGGSLEGWGCVLEAVGSGFQFLSGQKKTKFEFATSVSLGRPRLMNWCPGFLVLFHLLGHETIYQKRMLNMWSPWAPAQKETCFQVCQMHDLLSEGIALVECLDSPREVGRVWQVTELFEDRFGKHTRKGYSYILYLVCMLHIAEKIDSNPHALMFGLLQEHSQDAFV